MKIVKCMYPSSLYMLFTCLVCVFTCANKWLLSHFIISICFFINYNSYHDSAINPYPQLSCECLIIDQQILKILIHITHFCGTTNRV